jgi:hypothetical protein
MERTLANVSRDGMRLDMVVTESRNVVNGLHSQFVHVCHRHLATDATGEQ